MKKDRTTSAIERCFSGTLERPPRLLRAKIDAGMAEAHLSKAETNLRAMNLLLDNKFFDWSISCGYYAAYHAAQACLWLVGLDAHSHECTLAAFDAFYVKKGSVPKQYLDCLQRAQTLSDKYSNALEYAKAEREKAAYGLGEIRSHEAERVASDARLFVLEAKKLLYQKKGIVTA